MKTKIFAMSMILSGASMAQAQSNDEAFQSFAFDLFERMELQQEMKNYPIENTVLSPMSAWLALGMLQQGAEGTTLASIQQARHLTDGNSDTREFDQTLIKTLNEPDDWYSWTEKEGETLAHVQTPNAFWNDDQIRVHTPFAESLQTYYSAETGTLDLQKQESMDLIDQWVNEKTFGTIPSLGIEPSYTMRMLLVNALYFRCSWQEPFEEYFTRDEVFHGMNGNQVVPMMNKTLDCMYGATGSFYAVRIPLGFGNRFSMTFYIQNPYLDCFIRLNEREWREMQDNMKMATVTIKMPRFTTNGESTLNDELKAMGMSDAFGIYADFSRISDDDQLHVSLIKQLTHIEVNEHGTTASAVTSTVVDATGMHDDYEEKELNLDSPFYFTIEDAKNHKILFIGKVNTIEGVQTSNIDCINTEEADYGVYSLQGIRQAGLQRGINVVLKEGKRQIVYSAE